MWRIAERSERRVRARARVRRSGPSLHGRPQLYWSLFEDQQTVSVKPGVARVSGGRPQRAFGELEWITRPRGTTIPERRTVFVALVREEQGWRVTEIRVMP